MNKPTRRKVAFVGGGGVRTPLVIFGVQQSAAETGVEELVLYDPDTERARLITELGQAIIAAEGSSLKLRFTAFIEDAVEGASFVMNSIRVGGIPARTSDERASIRHGYPGQETTGPGGVAMALRTVGIAIEQARVVERLAPSAWLINFTNPAGLITQAIRHHTGARVVGICDTPTEMLHRIQTALGARADEVHCDYVGLNHLGWIRRIRLRGEDITQRCLSDDSFLEQLYSAPLFDHDLIRTLGLIPTEYLFFYYSRRRALENQHRSGSTRGAEIEALNTALLRTLAARLAAHDGAGAIQTYVDYLNTRSDSYMKLEGSGNCPTTSVAAAQNDPFRAATGYHRIALDVMEALTGARPARIIVNTTNAGAIPDVDPHAIVEVSSAISEDSIVPDPCDPLPESVRGLVLSVKAYEQAAIQAALENSTLLARKAMLLYPAIGEWEPSRDLLPDLSTPIRQP